MKVNLNELVGHMEMQFDEAYTYVNRKTGEIITVSSIALDQAETMEDEEIEELSDWEQVEVKAALDIIVNSMNYESIPSSYDINEYRMMEQFCYFVEAKDDQAALFDAIEGRGAFRRFKDKVNQLGLADEWYEFRDNCYKQIAIDFCEASEIEYE